MDGCVEHHANADHVFMVISERLEMWIPAPDETIWRDPQDTCEFHPES